MAHPTGGYSYSIGGYSNLKFCWDPFPFTRAPSLSLTAALKCNNVKLKIPVDPDMHMFFDKYLTCGISILSNHYAKAINPKVKEYDLYGVL